jgi:hypothetical protein
LAAELEAAGRLGVEGAEACLLFFFWPIGEDVEPGGAERRQADRWLLGGRERLRDDDARHQIAPVLVRCCTSEDGSNSKPGSETKRTHGSPAQSQPDQTTGGDR